MGRLVHIVDDDGDAREGARFLLEELGYATQSHAGGRQFLAAAKGDDGLVLLDLAMPGMSGFEVLAALKAAAVPLPVVVLTGYGDVEVAVRAMKLGAADFLEKPYEGPALAAAVEHAFALADTHVAGRRVRAEAAAKLALLTPRETQIVQGLRAGMANKRVARWLGLSPRTVEAYRANIMTRLDVGSLPALLRIAHDGSLPEIEQKAG